MTSTQAQTAFGRIFPPRDAWLAKAPPEPIIEPDLPIIDTHHHLWHRTAPASGESWEVPAFRYLLHEFLADCATGHNIAGSVFLQCHSMYRAGGPAPMRPVGETEFTAGIAAMGGGRFRGVRHSAGHDPDPVIGNSAPGIQPGLYLRPDFRAGMARLSALGLSLDAWCFHPQLPDITDLARAFPASNIIVGHCGGPLGYGRYASQRDAVFADWKRSITDLATCPNVSIKLGGMMMRLAAYDYLALDAPPSSEQLAAHWRPYIETCIERFGADRCLAESNFPVEKMGIGYAALFNTLKRLASGCSADEKAAIFAATARRVYRLDC